MPLYRGTLKYSVTKKIPTAFPNGSNYGYYFIIKDLAEQFKKTIYLFRRKHWKYKTLTVPIEKKLQKKKKLQKISYILQFIDSSRYVMSSY